ncbi:MAG: hypothetical protein QOG83_1683 [Alphaproteobacteria bacterium]|nr:hypothetical protein [Alphaproteobacteria bacterium]
MVRRCLAYAVVAACSSAAMLATGHAQTRAVIELFTSQGCSSCPPADKLVGELASDPTLVPISLPIDYWDYLGWKDTLADPRNTARQRAYSKTRGDRDVYTPQAVINGSTQALGSDKAAIEHAVAKSRQNPATLSLPVTLAVADGHLVISVPERSDSRASAEVWISGLAKSVTVLIKRGENKGKTITYHNVARRWLKIDGWDGKARTWSVPLRDLEADGIDGAAVFVQSGTLEKPSAIFGAALASIR